MFKKVCAILITVIFTTSAFAASAKNSLQIKGSDTMVNLGQAWAEKYMQKNPNDLSQLPEEALARAFQV